MTRIEIRPSRWINLPFLLADLLLLTVFAQVVFRGGFDHGSLSAPAPHEFELSPAGVHLGG